MSKTLFYFTAEGYGWHEDWLDNNKVHIFDVNGSKVKEMVDTFREFCDKKIKNVKNFVMRHD